MRKIYPSTILLILIVILLSTQANALDRYWVHKPFYENSFSTASEIAEWDIVEDNGTGSWELTGDGTALLTMDDGAGFFANRMFNVFGGAPNLLPLDIVNGRVEIFVKSISGGNQRIFVQVQQFNASNTYLGEFSLLPGQSATGYFSINFDNYTWDPAADKIRLIIGGENYSGQQGTVEFDYFSYSNDNGNWSNSANWSASSNGVGGATVPNSTDNAIFNGAGGNNGSCLLTSNTSVKGIDMTSGFTGNFDLKAFQLTIGSDGAYIAGGGVAGNQADIRVNGNLNISGGAFKNTSGTNAVIGDISITGGVLDFTTGSVTFDGTSSQVFNSTLVNPINKLIIDKSSSKMIFDSDILISDSLLLTNGILETNGNIIRLGLSNTTIGNLITGTGRIDGSLKRWISNSSTGSIYFPLGNDTTNAPVTLTINSPASTGGSITATYLDDYPAIDNVSFADGAYTITKRFTASWNIQTADLSGGIYSLSASNNNLDRFLILNDLHFTLFNSVVGTHQITTGTTSNPTLNRTGLLSSELAQNWYASIGEISLLPLTWGSFTATENDLGIELNWTTIQENNTSNFRVEHSIDGINFKELIQIEAKGFSSIPSNYSYLDENYAAGETNYYKIKQFDIDGLFTFSKVVAVNSTGNTKPLLTIIGPIRNEIQLISSDKGISVNIFDNSERLIKNQGLNTGLNTINSSQWSNGIYYISILKDGIFQETKKILKQ